ncbi:phospholipase, patatin family protein [Aspergillus uvarum CBS 121591]|uniref:Phospholipase, patatin family protein n=1 Tax=Aspergillus uvarum CBS 121591 TaxID=1448315 RepID=A0A319CY66_9EURO|nr:phospholipase, patatin family protein [Aspergillus uvarum CBS 121591]PYH80588.1 phospholipase, patatin family protein [Aspergillus uvarum CBS 121591]
MNPTVLAIDGGGVRGVIPLEFLTLIQESLGSCLLQDLIDISIGTSSGGLSVLALFQKRWEVLKCAKIFDDMARCIFQQRKSSSLSRLSQSVFGRLSLFSTIHKWLIWLLHDGCYDGSVFDAALKAVFGVKSRVFDGLCAEHTSATYSNTRIGVVATGISKDTSSFVFGNFNASETSETDPGCEIVRPVETDCEPFVWEAFFPTADIDPLGSFQDGGLRDNLAADIAKRLCRQIWPSRKNPARILSLGTGATARAAGSSPHFRHVFRDSFLRRSFNAWMSLMDTETEWTKMVEQSESERKQDYIRLNIPLQDEPSAIDAVETMEHYRNLVILYPGSARMAREAATALLISRFFFVMCTLPEDTTSPFWCWGVIRCKGPAKQIVESLEQLYPQGLTFTTDLEVIGQFEGLGELCLDCGRYCRPITFLSHHLDKTVNIYLKTRTKKRWRISGFPDSLASYAQRQHFYAPFGRPDHGCPGAALCGSCDESVGPQQGQRRKRASLDSRRGQRKKVRGGPSAEIS